MENALFFRINHSTNCSDCIYAPVSDFMHRLVDVEYDPACAQKKTAGQTWGNHQLSRRLYNLGCGPQSRVETDVGAFDPQRLAGLQLEDDWATER